MLKTTWKCLPFKLDCASNEKITNLTRIIDIENDESLNGVDNLNRYEAEFWQNTLICSQLYPKGHEKYELKNNRCCRDNSLRFFYSDNFTNSQDTNEFDPDNFNSKKPYLTTTTIPILRLPKALTVPAWTSIENQIY